MDEGLRFTLKKTERVSGEKRIENLFANGCSFISYPLRVVYLTYEGKSEQQPVSMFVSVPKKRLKSAVKRNRIKRMIRESYRLNKHILTAVLNAETNHTDIGFIYVKDELADYGVIEKGMCKALVELANRCTEQKNITQ